MENPRSPRCPRAHSHPAPIHLAPELPAVDCDAAVQPKLDAGADVAAEIKRRAVKLLSSREHSRTELAHKLKARCYPAIAVDAVLDELERTGMLSEARLLETYVAERLAKGFGPLRIRVELREKGLSDKLIGPYLSFDNESLLALVAGAHDRRFGAGSRQDRETLAKRARFLEYRGFPSHAIARFLDTDR